jgi:hypothetical protein
MTMNVKLPSLVAAALVASCAPLGELGEGVMLRHKLKPDHAFSHDLAPPAPDYGSPKAWAALPDRPDSADQAPEGVSDAQAGAAADVFFIHPTTFFKKDGWNAPYDEPGVGPMGVDEGTMRSQASAFNGCCRVFAPRYRQATLYAFLHFDENSEAAQDLAYQDVAAAFDNFINERNGGRPFIIASHSQGSYHAMRLVEERVLGKAVAERLVAVYAIGGPVPAAFTRENLPACENDRQTGCLIGWNTVSAIAKRDRRRDKEAIIWLEAAYRRVDGRPLLCVNPLNWDVDGAAPASLNLGALPGKQAPGRLSAPLAGYAGAACREGYLVVDAPEGSVEFNHRLTRKGSFHIYDYNLFYMNIRVNAQARVKAYLAGEP